MAAAQIMIVPTALRALGRVQTRATELLLPLWAIYSLDDYIRLHLLLLSFLRQIGYIFEELSAFLVFRPLLTEVVHLLCRLLALLGSRWLACPLPVSERLQVFHVLERDLLSEQGLSRSVLAQIPDCLSKEGIFTR